MNKGIYIATLEPDSGKSLVSLGLMRALLGKTAKVGYFRPIISDAKTGERDNHIDTVLSYFDIDMAYEQTYAFTHNEVVKKRNKNKGGEILDGIIEKYKQVEAAYDFVLVEGTDFSGEGSVFEFDVNVLIAKNLGIPVVIISSGVGKSKEEMMGSMQMAYNAFSQKDVNVLALIANKIQPHNLQIALDGMLEFLPDSVAAFAIPMIEKLGNPTMKEIVRELNGKVLFGEEYLDNETGNFGVGAMQLSNYLNHLKENTLVITPGDRADIILGALQANVSSNYPRISGIILTGGLLPEDTILRLIDGLSQVVPMISVEDGTFNVANRIGAIKSNIYADSIQKVETSIQTFEKYVPIDKLIQGVIDFTPKGITPRMFQYSLLQRAKQSRKRIVLPEGHDERILQAAERLSALNIVDIILLGDPEKIQEKIIQLSIPLDFAKVEVINPITSEYFNDFVETFYELRKHKNVNLDIARDCMTDVSYFGTMMIYKNLADGMVSGAAHTTQHTIRPALQFIKTKPGVSVVSS